MELRTIQAIAGLLSLAGSAAAQSAPPAIPGPTPDRLKEIPLITDEPEDQPATSKANPNDPAVKAALDARRKQLALEREIRTLRFRYFRTSHAPTRARGLDQLRALKDEATFGIQLKVFETDDADVKAVMLGNFREARDEVGDRALTWVAVTDGSDAARTQARLYIVERTTEAKETPRGVLGVLNGLILAGEPEQQRAGAGLASTLQIYETIPALLTAALPGDEDRQGDLAWIAITTQTAYVGSVVPVVATNSVGFQAVPATVTTGSLLRIRDATVTTVSGNVDLMPALYGMADTITGGSTRGLGRDRGQWAMWYSSVYEPFMARRNRALLKAEPKTAEPTPSPAQP